MIYLAVGYEQYFNLFNIESGHVKCIKSFGYQSPKGFWHEQPDDEWVIVLEGQGEIEFLDGSKQFLQKGDSLFIPRLKKHRVSYTSCEVPCVWLAIYGDIELEGNDD